MITADEARQQAFVFNHYDDIEKIEGAIKYASSIGQYQTQYELRDVKSKGKIREHFSDLGFNISFHKQETRDDFYFMVLINWNGQ